ncbi:MAG: hydantoinase/oxoprolinase family protein, partial [Pseudomonadota bacterium]|nr:hydantoinase/oxoprolinase family protein [Pseudomonadota bacterium]
MSAPRVIVGVDVGGTFTDVFFLDEAAGTTAIAKVPTTKPDQSAGFLDGIRAEVSDFATIATVVHGTTVATNALLEKNGARTGIITTAGFRDVLEMRRRDRPQTWGLWGQFSPVVPRDLRLEVAERTLADGTRHTEIDPAEVAEAARALRARGVEAVAIVFINAYANPANERAALAAVKAVWPNEYIVTSHEILPEIREFERTSTTTLNAYLQPPIATYLRRLEDALRAEACDGDVLIVQSNGGVMTLETACQRPIRTALSGPAAGVIASAHIAEKAGFPNVITCDMGGTSFDVSLVVDGASTLTAQAAVDFGMVVRTPMIEMTTIGAGGGSIAWVDRGGLLQIGPESAGSDPGPACYGAGNARPTVTDANLVLGRINPARPIGGKLAALDMAAAQAAIMAEVGTPLGLDVLAAADAIVRVANARMAGAIRLVSIERGHNPTDFVAMPFGGGGALHAGALIKDIGLKAAVVPMYPGVISALGCTIADMRHDFIQTLNGMLDTIDTDAIAAKAAELAAAGDRLLDEARVAFAGRETIVAFDMSYVGQTHTVDVTLPAGAAIDRATIAAAFEARYRAVFAKPLTGIAIRILNLRVSVIGRRDKLDPR